jgi:hypothetical protein
MMMRLKVPSRYWMVASMAGLVAVSVASGAHAQTKAIRLPGNIRFERVATTCESALPMRGNTGASILSGCVRGVDLSAGAIHILMSGQAGTSLDAEADKSGHFGFRNVAAGCYFLHITQAGRTLAISAAWVPSEVRVHPMVIDLGTHDPSASVMYFGDKKIAILND